MNGAKFPFIFNPIKGQSELLYTQHDQVRVSARGDVRDPVAGKVGQLRVSLVRGAHMDRQLSAESDASRMRISGTLIDVANVESETCPCLSKHRPLVQYRNFQAECSGQSAAVRTPYPRPFEGTLPWSRGRGPCQATRDRQKLRTVMHRTCKNEAAYRGEIEAPE